MSSMGALHLALLGLLLVARSGENTSQLHLLFRRVLYLMPLCTVLLRLRIYFLIANDDS